MRRASSSFIHFKMRRRPRRQGAEESRTFQTTCAVNFTSNPLKQYRFKRRQLMFLQTKRDCGQTRNIRGLKPPENHALQNVSPRGFKDISMMRIWLMGENSGPTNDVTVSRCNPLVLSPISRRLRVPGMGRGSSNPLGWIRGAEKKHKGLTKNCCLGRSR